jgi:hypothetical protein
MQPWKNRLRKSGNECGEDHWRLHLCDGPLAPWMKVLGMIGSPPLATLYRSHCNLLIALDRPCRRAPGRRHTWAHELDGSRTTVGFTQINAARRCIVPDPHPASYLDLRSVCGDSNTASVFRPCLTTSPRLHRRPSLQAMQALTVFRASLVGACFYFDCSAFGSSDSPRGTYVSHCTDVLDARN